MNGSKYFPAGTMCLILGPAQTDEGREFDCLAVMIDGLVEDIHPSNLEPIDEPV
jgi:hypothetical protein